MREFRYLIIGNSAAGVSAAEAIREVDREGSIAIVSDEPYHTYSRALIGHYLAGQTPVERMGYRPADFYERLGITPILGRRAVRLVVRRRQVELDGGELLKYGDCLLATGGRPFLPKIDGLDLRGVTTFLSLDDARRLESYLPGAKKAVVIGGGLIGMQVAEALRERGREVTVVELLPRVLAPVLDETGSRLVEDLFRSHGVSIVTGRSAAAVVSRADDPARVGGVRLDNGEVLPADIVVAAIGVVPRAELAEAAGAPVRRGVVVDSRMRTSAAHLYAAGDVAEVRDFLLGVDRAIPIWPSATLGGRAAGFNMAGKPAEFPGVTGMNAADFFGFPVVSAGIVNPKPEDKIEILTRQDPESRRLARLMLRDNRVVGMEFAGGAVDRAGVYYGMMRDDRDVSAFRDLLLDEEFNFLAMPEGVRREKIA